MFKSLFVLFFSSFLVLTIFVDKAQAASAASCYVDLDPEKLTVQSCPKLNPSIPAINLKSLQESLTHLYRSAEVQSSAAHCGKMADLMQAICNRPLPVKSFFVPVGAARVQSIKTVDQSQDARLKPRPDAAVVLDPYPRSSSSISKCKQDGIFSLTLTAQCGALHRCESTKLSVVGGRSDVFPVSVSTVGGVTALRDATGKIVVPHTEYIPMLYHYTLYGNCTRAGGADDETIAAYDLDSHYLSIDPKTNFAYANPSATVAPYCAPGSSSCLFYNIPLLNQNGADLLRLVSKRTRIAHPQDVGFCAPTTLAMMMEGIRGRSGGVLGDAFDTGANSQSKIDGFTAPGWSGAIYQSGQEAGADWWVGGTPQQATQAAFASAFGEAAGTIGTFVGSNNYTNVNLIEFINKFGGWIQMPISYDTTSNNPTYHSVMIAGHAGGHLQLLDPWQRAYLVDINNLPRNAVFFKVTSTIFNYKVNPESTKFEFPYTNGQKLIWEWKGTPSVGQSYPVWYLNFPDQNTFLNYLVSLGVVTREDRTGTSVPTISFVSGEQGFVYTAPSQQAQLLPETEVAVINPGPGTYFQAADSQNVIDVLYGIGQRVRASLFLKIGKTPDDVSFAAGVAAVNSNGGWLGSTYTSPTFISSVSDVAPISVTYSGSGVFTASNAWNARVRAPLTLTPTVKLGGWPDQYSISPALPAGLTLDSKTGVISGIPTQALVLQNFNLTARNQRGSIVVTLPIVILDEAPSRVTTAHNRSTISVYGGLYSTSFTVEGGVPTSVTVTPNLPLGLSAKMGASTGQSVRVSIDGSATAPAPSTTYNFVFANSRGMVTASITFAVTASTEPLPPKPDSISYSPANFVGLPLGVALSGTLIQSPTYTGSYPNAYQISPKLPAGLEISGFNGEITGTPLEVSDSREYEVTASNAGGFAKTKFLLSVVKIVLGGSCGLAHGVPSLVAPTEGLCAIGAPSAILPINNVFNWTCGGISGGSSASCSSPFPKAGRCGKSNGAVLSSVPSENLCSFGTAQNMVSSETSYTWKCEGQGGAAATSCSANRVSSGSCGTADGKTASTTPSENLCATGMNSIVKSGPTGYSWSCSGINFGPSVSCSANYPIAGGSCGSSHGKTLTAAPIANLCNVGSPSAVKTSTTIFTWSCDVAGGATTSCSAKRPTSGKCGLATASSWNTIPTGNLCAIGTSSSVTSSETSYSWDCSGLNGGPIQNCAVVRSKNGECGSARDASLAAPPLAADLCLAGSPSSVTLNNSIYSWTCSGAGEGQSESCSAKVPSANCGDNAGKTLTSTSPSLLCKTGTASYVQTFQTGFSWSCIGGTNTTCMANRPTLGSCGQARSISQTSEPTGSRYLCSVGVPSTVTSSTTNYSWSCRGVFGGGTTNCSTRRIIPGICGDAATKPATGAPINHLCSSGSPSAVTTSNLTYNWICFAQGFYSYTQCSTPRAITGTCGTANGVNTINSTIGFSRCLSGTDLSPISNPLNYTWECLGESSSQACSATVPTCGEAHGKASIYPPNSPLSATSGVPLCATGSASMVWTLPQEFAWNCSGLGKVANCKSRRLAIVNGACGTATTSTTSSAPTSDLCALGTPTIVSSNSKTHTWVCKGSDGGFDSPMCIAAISGNGSCGSAVYMTHLSVPSGAVLCSLGSASTVVVEPTVYKWNCSGVSCQANRSNSDWNGGDGGGDGGGSGGGGGGSGGGGDGGDGGGN